VAPTTYQLHRDCIDDFCSFEYAAGKTIGRTEYRKLTLAHVNQWIAERSNRPTKRWSPNYVRMYLRILRIVFRWAAREGELVSEPLFARKGKPHRLPAEDLTMKRQAITEPEHVFLLKRLSRRHNGNFGQVLSILWATGARPAEVYLARADEWKPERQAIVIDPTDKRSIGRLKTRRKLMAKGRKRIIRVPDELVPVINELAANALPTGELFYRENRKPWVRPGQSLGRKRSPAAERMAKLIKRANRKAKVIRAGVSLYSYLDQHFGAAAHQPADVGRRRVAHPIAGKQATEPCCPAGRAPGPRAGRPEPAEPAPTGAHRVRASADTPDTPCSRLPESCHPAS
jgi:integrase